jgi:hypothetical protein
MQIVGNFSCLPDRGGMKRSRSSFFNRMSLAWQIVVLLSIALLPIGGLAVFEAMRANDRAKSLAASDLLADARQAAESVQVTDRTQTLARICIPGVRYDVLAY